MASTLGYCLMPFVFAAAVNLFLVKLVTKWVVILFCDKTKVWICCVVAYFWCLKAAHLFIGANARPNRKSMVMYPIGLYYLFFVFFIGLD